MSFIQRFMYGRVHRLLEKKASKYYDKKYLAKELKLEGFHNADVLLITLTPRDPEAKIYEEKMILSEHREQLDLFLQKIKSAVNNYESEVYSQIIMDFDNRENRASVIYLDKLGKKHPFNLNEKY